MIYWIGLAILAIIIFCITRNMALLAGVALFIGVLYCIILFGRWAVIAVWEFLSDYPLLLTAAIFAGVYGLYLIYPPLALVLLGLGAIAYLTDSVEQWGDNRKDLHQKSLQKWLEKNGCYLGQVQIEMLQLPKKFQSWEYPIGETYESIVEEFLAERNEYLCRLLQAWLLQNMNNALDTGEMDEIQMEKEIYERYIKYTRTERFAVLLDRAVKKLKQSGKLPVGVHK